jgi:hypothetical protein
MQRGKAYKSRDCVNLNHYELSKADFEVCVNLNQSTYCGGCN